MRSKVIMALAVLNAALLTALAMQWWTPPAARAQVPAAGRVGDYTMLPGEIIGGNGGSLVYIIDNSTGQLSARQLTDNQVVDMPPIALDRVLNRR